MDYLATFNTKQADVAELVVDRVLSRLSHINPAVVLAATKVLLKFVKALNNEQITIGVCRKVSSPLVSLLSGPSESAWVLLRNIHAIADNYPGVFPNARVFFTNYNDPPYVKIEKLKIIYKLCDKTNFKLVINELVEYSYDVNQEFSREAVRRLWNLALRIPEALDDCHKALHQILVNISHNSFADHLINETAIGLSYIYKKYSNSSKLNDSIAILVQSYTKISEQEALVEFLNLLPIYDTLIQNRKDLVTYYSEKFIVSPLSVQSAILTAMVKLYVINSDELAEEIIEILQTAADSIQNPDIRDRAFMYWRLVDISPLIAKRILFSKKEAIEREPDTVEPGVDDDFDQIGSLKVTMNLQSTKTTETKPFIRKEQKVSEVLTDELIGEQKEDLFDLDIDQPVVTNTNGTNKTETAQNNKDDLFDIFGNSGKKESVKSDPISVNINTIDINNGIQDNQPKSFLNDDKYNEFDMLAYNTEYKATPEPVNQIDDTKKKGESAFDFDMYDIAIKENPPVQPFTNFKKNAMKNVLSVNTPGRSGKAGIQVSGALIATDVDLSFQFELKNSTTETINFIKFKLKPNLYGFSIDNNAAKLELQPQKTHKMACSVIPTDLKSTEWRLDNNHSFTFELVTDYDEFEFTVESYVNSLMVG